MAADPLKSLRGLWGEFNDYRLISEYTQVGGNRNYPYFSFKKGKDIVCSVLKETAASKVAV